jgi:hypothetical protein
MAQQHNCVGILRGVPAKLQAQADADDELRAADDEGDKEL